jgi:hypothetical protein
MRRSPPQPRMLLAASLVAMTVSLSIGLGACGRSQQVTAPVGRDGSVAFAVPAALKAPDKPGLKTPPNGAKNVSTSPTLVWNPAPRATQYRVQVSALLDFSVLLVDRSEILTTSTAITGLRPATKYFWRASAQNAAGSSPFSNPSNFTTGVPAAPNPCASLTGFGGEMTPGLAEVRQFRPGRMRIEVTADVAPGTLDQLGTCAAKTKPAVTFTSGTGDVLLAGSSRSVTLPGGVLHFGALAPIPGETGALAATDALENTLEVIWPRLAGEPGVPPVVRLQLASWDGAARPGVSLDVVISLEATAPDGTKAAFTVTARRVLLPPLKALVSPTPSGGLEPTQTP